MALEAFNLRFGHYIHMERTKGAPPTDLAREVILSGMGVKLTSDSLIPCLDFYEMYKRNQKAKESRRCNSSSA